MVNNDPWHHLAGGRFVNPEARAGRSFFDLLRWQLGTKRARWPRWVDNPAVEPPPRRVEPGQVAITFVHHATFLIRTHNVALLTDPVWAKRVGPIGFGPARVRDPGLAFDHLPRIDAVLLSHNHYDHMDLSSLAPITREHGATIITPLQNGQYLKRRGIEPAIELDWWQSRQVSDAAITLVPAQHWSNRLLIARNVALWGGFMLQVEGKSIYFPGDTGYWQRLFLELRERFAPIDLALLPIGAYEPRWFMQSMHMNPDDAVRAFIDMGATRALGMHYGSWQLTDEPIDAPIRALEQARVVHGVAPERFMPATIGATVII